MSMTTTNDDTLVGPSVSHQSVPHQVNRLIFDAGQPYEKFLSRFAAVVPPMDPRLPLDCAWRHARWPGIVPEADLVMLYAPLRALTLHVRKISDR
jgi:hypothetical protein